MRNTNTRAVSVILGFDRGADVEVRELEDATFKGIGKTTKDSDRRETGLSLKLRRCKELYIRWAEQVTPVTKWGRVGEEISAEEVIENIIKEWKKTNGY